MHALTESNRFATFFWAVFDENARTLTWVNAGHNAPMLLRATGALERLRAERPAPRGGRRGDLPPGDDRAFSGRPPDRLHRRRHRGREPLRGGVRRGPARETRSATTPARPWRTLCQRIVDAVQAFEAGLPQLDDITVVAARATR